MQWSPCGFWAAVSIALMGQMTLGKSRHLFVLCTWPSRPFNYNSINTTCIFFFFNEKTLFKFLRIKLWEHGKCLFSLPSIRKTVNRKSLREPAPWARSPQQHRCQQSRDNRWQIRGPSALGAHATKRQRQRRFPGKLVWVPVIMLCK